MNLIEHAKSELLALGYTPASDNLADIDKRIQENILELIEVFSEQDHSGHSAAYCLKMFARLADFKPLSPITCEDREWSEVREDEGKKFYQNNRLSSVFKEGDSKPYYIDAIVWRNQEGVAYTGGALDSKGNRISSSQNIRLPFTPKTFYIDVIEKEIAKDDWEFYVKHEEDLDQVWEYYEKA